MYISVSTVQKPLDTTERLTLEQVCGLLSISTATAKNWIRLGKLKVCEDGITFDKIYVERLVDEIKSGHDTRLKNRRNKKSVTGNVLYKDYVKNENNRNVVSLILEICKHISEEELRVIIAFFATQLYCQKNGVSVSDDKTFNTLIGDLVRNIDLTDFDYSNIKFVFQLNLEFISTEDTLGFIYISLQDLSQRKQTGAYYTPVNTVSKLIDNLIDDGVNLVNKTFCDPCCGTGNFLIGLVERGIDSNNLYGEDIDELSILITRINMFLLNPDLSEEQLKTHFICGNTLENTFCRSFSVVLGNPPWGYGFSKDETEFLLKNYKTGKAKGMESYDLFIEKGLDLLENGGHLAYVLPEAILSVASHLQARKLILEHASFRFVLYLGNAFSGVQCPAIILGLQNDGRGTTEQCKVLCEEANFVIGKDRRFEASLFSFNMNDCQYECFEAIENVHNQRRLANNAKFALGIVTGNNKEYIVNSKKDGYETILKGSDILRYGIKASENYIRFVPEKFQQVAPAQLYRAEEKLLYRFISEVPVFAYDDKQRLSLNSCNILIPQIEGMNIKYVLAVLNSSVAAFYLNRKYNSVKLLRSHIESLPIPMVSDEIQKRIVKMVETIISTKNNVFPLYSELDKEIFSLYSLSSKQQDIINHTLCGKTTFLK